MENHAANPAGRLWLYFSEMSTKQVNKGVHFFAAPYFGTEGIDQKYVAAMARLMELPDHVEAAVAAIERPPLPVAKLLRPLDSVRTVFHSDPLATNNVAWLKEHVDGAALSELETTSHILNGVAQKGEIPTETLDKIRSLAARIIELATDDDGLDDEAKRAFIRYAHRISEAADLYKVSGAQPILDELDRFTQETRRMRTAPGPALWSIAKQLTATVVLAVELFMVPVNVDNALEYYGEMFPQHQLIEAPAPSQPSDDIVDAEVVEDDEPAGNEGAA